MKLGFIGLGIMGTPMAGHLRAAGHELFVTTRSKLPPALLDAGAVPRNLDGEVLEFRCLAMADLWDMITHGAFTLEAELAILDSLRHRLRADVA